jgi:2-polyprenyl-6-hydroxyphenyl methylase/3-demethylubiquinone-9 3-methyltransferase
MVRKIELYENIYNKKFSFGKNWNLFLKNLNDEKINIAKDSLIKFTKLKNFKEKTFIDFGCGSGLFSLCAVLLGAKKVISVDIDDNSLNCAKYLRKKYGISKKVWEIKKGSALDEKFIKGLGKFDIVYSWGVLHHTGEMWSALKNITFLVKKSGLLYIAIYNNFKGFPFYSSTWIKIKNFYSSSNIFIRKIIEIPYIFLIFFGLLFNGINPISYMKNYSKNSLRGMSFYRDIVDWLGGYPYEYASVEEIKKFYEKLNFKLINLNKTNREGCNEFLLKKNEKKT